MNRRDLAVWLEQECPAEAELKKYYLTFHEPVSPDRFRKCLAERKEKTEVCSADFSAMMAVADIPDFPKEATFSDQYWADDMQEIVIRRHLRYSPPMPHTHKFVEVAYVYSGRCRQTFFHKGRPEEHVTLGEGMLCILPPGTVHEISVFDESTVVNILIRANVMRDSLSDLVVGNHMLYDFFLHALFHEDRPGYLIFDTKNSDQIKNLILDMMTELCENKAFSQKAVHLMLGLFFTYLQRDFSEDIQFSEYAAAGFSYIPQILSYIQKNYRSTSVEDISGHFSMSRTYLNRIFKDYTNTTVSAALIRERIHRACEYLENTDFTVQQTAEAVGYNDVTHFIRLFKKTCGVTPLQYRKQFRH